MQDRGETAPAMVTEEIFFPYRSFPGEIGVTKGSHLLFVTWFCAHLVSVTWFRLSPGFVSFN
jgi:hypothetical protein